MKRTLWATAMVVVLAGLVTIPLMAQPPHGRGMGMGPRGMGMGPGGPGGPGGRGGGPMGLLRGIELTDAQRDQIRSIMDEHRQDPQAGQQAELNKQLQLAILADTLDTRKIEELKRAIAAGTAEALNRRIDLESRCPEESRPACARRNKAS